MEKIYKNFLTCVRFMSCECKLYSCLLNASISLSELADELPNWLRSVGMTRPPSLAGTVSVKMYVHVPSALHTDRYWCTARCLGSATVSFFSDDDFWNDDRRPICPNVDLWCEAMTSARRRKQLNALLNLAIFLCDEQLSVRER